MSEWALKRFWTSTEIVPVDGGFTVTLDGRNVRTPGKALLTVPTRAMAERIAGEWDAQTERVDPTTMPWTRSANSAIDKLSVQRVEVEDHLIEYAGTDLLSYRAEGPSALVQKQSDIWDPILDWAENRYGARLLTTAGVMPVAQRGETLASLRNVMSSMSNFSITGFHDLVTLSGSYILALAVIENHCSPSAAWGFSRLDEEWQIEQWGRDEEADTMAEVKRAAFLHAADFFLSA